MGSRHPSYAKGIAMKALVVDTAKHPPQLRERDVPLPVIGAGDVLVRVAACGVCYHDVAVTDGTLRRGVKADVVLGHEIAGIVADTGDEVIGIRPGDRVVAALTAFCGKCMRCAAEQEYRCINGQGFGHGLDGGFAEYVLLPERSAIPLPKSLDGLDLRQAALLACPIGVAVNATEDVARLRPHETALVVGAGGGLGIHLVQAAAATGARTIAVTTSENKAAVLDALTGVEAIVADPSYGLDFSEIVLALTDDNGVDVALNPVGSAMFRSCLASMAQYGRMVVLGEIVGEAVRFNLAELLFRDATVIGASGASLSHIRRAMAHVAAGRIKPILSEAYGFDSTSEAMAQMRQGSTYGRVVIVPG